MIGGGGTVSGFGSVARYLTREKEKEQKRRERQRQRQKKRRREKQRKLQKRRHQKRRQKRRRQKKRQIREDQPRSEVAEEYADRVGHVKTRNLVSPADDLDTVVAEMDAGAAASERVEKEGFHLHVSFAEEDQTTRQERIEAVEEVLEDIGLGDRQAFIVDHRDGGNHNTHALVNRVQHNRHKDDYGTAWESWRSAARIQKSLRKIEKERGWRQVESSAGKEAENESKGWTRGQMGYYRRTGELPLEEQVRAQTREHFEKVKEGEIEWKELDRELWKQGLQIERKGSGGVVRDEASGKAVKLSSIDREYSLPRLEEAVGEEYSTYVERQSEPRDERFEAVLEQDNRQQPGEQDRERKQRNGAAPKPRKTRRDGGGKSRGAETAARGGEGGKAEPAARRGDSGARGRGGSARPDGGSSQGGSEDDREHRGAAARGSDRLETGGADVPARGGGPEKDRGGGGGNRGSQSGLSGDDQEGGLDRVEVDISLDGDRDSGDLSGDLDSLRYSDAQPYGLAGRVESGRAGIGNDQNTGADRDGRGGAGLNGGEEAEQSSPAGGEKSKGAQSRSGGGRPGAGGHGRGRSFAQDDGVSESSEDSQNDPSGEGEDLDYYDRISRALNEENAAEDESEEQDLLERLLDRSNRQDAREVCQELRRRRREEEARQLSRKWEKEDRTRLRLEGEEGKIRPSLEQGETAEAAQAFRDLEDERKDAVWDALSGDEQAQVFEGAAEVKRREAGVQEAYERLTEQDQAIARQAQISAMRGNEGASKKISEDLEQMAGDGKDLSGKTSKIQSSLPSKASKTILKKASEAVDQSQDDAPDRDRYGRGR